MSFRRAINLFPWDVQAEGAGPCLEAIAGLGCSAVVLSPNYHRARLFRPRAQRYHHRTVDWCDFTPDTSLYAEPALLPPVNPDAGCVEACRAAVPAARARGLEVIASVIGCHNTTLGLAHPELCLENAGGDRYAFALCPAQPRVRAHLTSLVRDVARQLRPDAVVLDSFSYLDAVHREHHELMFVSPGAHGKFLLSLCFCPACRERVARENIDPWALRDRTRELLRASVTRPPPPRSAEWERDEVAGARDVVLARHHRQHQALRRHERRRPRQVLRRLRRRGEVGLDEEVIPVPRPRPQAGPLRPRPRRRPREQSAVLVDRHAFGPAGRHDVPQQLLHGGAPGAGRGEELREFQ